MLVDLGTRLRAPWQRRVYRVVGPWLESRLGLPQFEAVYQRARELYVHHEQAGTCYAWFDSVIASLGITGRVAEPAEFSFPRSGPLVVVANHPFGILDPCLLARYVAAQRPDLKVMTNALLSVMPELAPHIITVNPFGGPDAARGNVRGMKEALRHLRAGGALLVFPAGEVAAYRPGRGVEEAAWSQHVGSLVRRAEATVLPVFFSGGNSPLFHAAGLLHPRLRTGLLLREFHQQRRSQPEMRVGLPIAFGKLRKFTDDSSLTRYLRVHTMILRGRPRRGVFDSEFDASPLPASNTGDPRFTAEVQALRARGACLVGQGGLSVFVAHSHDIPHLLHEIGRLRERTFREAGEGTGEDVDLDRFDAYYEHLFLWDEERQRIAGAYRLGRADLILREYGPKGLYTNTLFRFEKPFLAHLESAVEMGRSFIIKEYQRNLSALPLLWKGIAQWMHRNPAYMKLFGPVSISKDYNQLSRKMMVEFLQGNCLNGDLADFVKPRTPFRYLRNRRLMREFISAQLRDVEDCSALISSVELDRKGIPVLLKHYLRLNGTLLSFNVDKHFSSVIDGLILVDLTRTDPKLLAKYMGEEKCAEYLRQHQLAGV